MDLKYRQEKIQEKRKQTPWREFVKLASWYPFVFYRKGKFLSRYNPDNGRVKNIAQLEDYNQEVDSFADKYCVEYSGDIFQDISNLLKIVPLCSIKNVGENPNSEYGDIIFFSKNVYLSSVALSSENVLYSFQTKDSKNVYNSVMVWKGSDNVYFSRVIFESYNIFYSSYIRNSNNVWFSSNLIGCNNCIDCHNLENKSYCIANKQYTKEEYEAQKKLICRNKNDFINKYDEVVKNPGNNIACEVEGQGNMMCKNVSNSYWCSEVKNGRNTFLVGGAGTSENMYDVFSGGMEANNNFYGVMGAGYHTENIYCSAEVAVNSSYCFYSYFLEGCSYCLGCVGLKNKSFCILNKQYSKEERFKLTNKIFEKMDNEGVLGEFFPGKLNPFYFNDTAAYLIDDSFTKEEVEKEGYLRRDEEIKVDIPESAEIIETKDLGQYEGFNENGEWNIDFGILKKVIKDEKGNYYRIVKMEYDFLMKYGLPLPRLHWLDRIKLGFKFK